MNLGLQDSYKILIRLIFITCAVLGLAGCLASPGPPVGITCDFSQGKALWEMPLACQGR